MKQLIKSPLNYTGGKFKLLPQILPLFPADIKTFVDVFGGGFNVGINVDSDCVIYNELDSRVCDIIRGIKDGENNITNIENIIEKYNLSKTNKDGFLDLRQHYNKDNLNRTWINLYTLLCYGFNNQIRFNSKGEYNIPFAGDREFNLILKQKFNEFDKALKSKNVLIKNKNFTEIITKDEQLSKDMFFYCDPPYLISTATYNENGGWSETLERQLLDSLDYLNSLGIKFALSNVTYHKDMENRLLIDWANKYKTIILNKNYNNCAYNKKPSKNKTTEVLIINY